MLDSKTCSIITVTVKDDEKNLRSKFLIYEPYSINENDPIIKDCIARSLKDFGSEPTEIDLRVNLKIL